ncbi:MAG: B12-binding domain-containing radical SAM protein [Prevotella sp.]|nr:B12-binding domain-containing radical SAM protein [Bacteroides sp.]MCM1366503.1 B12-binding domain-containing radical SAM protein [Prevotella sp.]MCM1436842.1 B12-binding domain-containing radical SAM protein [Prevotella sp.]
MELSKLKITFLIPPVFRNDVKPAERSAGCTRIVYPFPNIYELTVAALFEEMGWKVRYRDFVYYNESPQKLEEFIEADDSDIYCIWGVNLSIPDDAETIQIISRIHPEAYILMFGPAGTYFPDKLLLNDHVVIVRGEPEETAREWTQLLSQGGDILHVDGTTVLIDGKRHLNPSRPVSKSFDSLPFPARHLIEDKEYHNPKLKTGPYTTMLTSRNCPFQCIYCVPSSLTFARELDYRRDHGTKPPISYRSAQSVEKELRLLHEQGYKAIGFVDDNFIWNEKRTAELCAPLRKYGFVWGCQARVDAITEPIAKLLSESGCRYVDLGMESFDEGVLKYIKKGITRDQIYQAIGLLQKYNVPVKLNFLIGTSPLETKETIRDTLRRAKKLGVDQVMFNIVSPFPGTELYQLAKENGWIESGEYRPTDVQRESILNYPHLSAREMEKILFRSNISFFLRPSFIFKHIRRFRSWKEFTSAAKALKIKLFG